MIDLLKIYVDRLRNGTSEKLGGSVAPDFLDVEDGGVCFKEPVHIKGEANVAESTLIVQLHVETVACLPCVICNEVFDYPLRIEKMYITIPMEEIQGGIVDLSSKLREEILLEVPQYAECHEGQCPSRKKLSRFLKSDGKQSEDDSYYPFAGL